MFLIKYKHCRKYSHVSSERSKIIEANDDKFEGTGADLLNVNIVSEREVIPSSFIASTVKPLSPHNIRKNPLKRRNSKDVAFKHPEPKNNLRKSAKSNGLNKSSSVLGKSFLNTSKSKSYIQPTLNFFQKESRVSRAPEVVQEIEEDPDMTFCSGLELMNENSLEEMPSQSDLAKISPKRRSLSLNKSIAKKSHKKENEDGAVFGIRSTEKQKSPLKNPFIKCEKASPKRKVESSEKDLVYPSSAALFDTQDFLLDDSVILLDSEKLNDPIVISDDTRQDSVEVLNMEQQILQYQPSETDRRFSEHSNFGNREDVSLALQRMSVEQELDPKQKDPIRIPNMGCKDCTAYYKYLRKNNCSSQEALKRVKCSHKKVRPDTPEGFWNVGFTPTEEEFLLDYH